LEVRPRWGGRAGRVGRGGAGMLGGGLRASLAGERVLLLQIGGDARVEVRQCQGSGWGGGPGLDVRYSRGWRCGRGGAGGGSVRACVNVHALASQCTVLQLACILSCQPFHAHNCLQCPQRQRGNHTSAQKSTQRRPDIGHCRPLTLFGAAMAFLGQRSPQTRHASAFETAPVSIRRDAHSRGGHADSSCATRLRRSAGHGGRR